MAIGNESPISIGDIVLEDNRTVYLLSAVQE